MGVGGGFVTNENFNSSNNAPQKVQVPYEKRKLSQITIKQIITAPPPQPEENLKVDGQEISQVVLIAKIESIDIQSSHTTLRINDYSGSIDAKQWHNDDQQPSEAVKLSEGRWVRVNGRMNSFQGRCSINVFNIIPITNFNEITHHFLEVIYSHLLNTKDGQGNNNQNNGNNNNQQWNNQQNGQQHNNNQHQMQHNNMNNNKFVGLKGDIMTIIARGHNETGCNVSAVFQQLNNEDVNEIRSAIDDLCTDGHIYSTIDDEHFKCSDEQ